MKKILVIDDQKDNLISITAILKTFLPEYKILTAQSGSEGIVTAKREKPDTILLDIIMPIMDGYEVCKKLKKDKPTKHIPVILITAIKTDLESRLKGLEIGADAFLSKPIDPAELSAQIKVMLRIKSSEDKLRSEKVDLNKLIEANTKDLYKTNRKLQLEITKYKQTEEALKESEKNLNRAQEISKTGNWEWHIQKDEIIWSDEVFRLFGFEIGSKVDFRRYLKSVYPDDRENVIKWVNETLKGAPYENAHRIIKNGEIRWHYTIGELIRDDKGEPLKLFGVVQDITERKQAEETLRISEERLRSVTENSSDHIILVGKDLKIIFINKTVPDLKKKDVIGRRIIDFIPKDFQKLAVDKYQSVFKTGKPANYQTEYLTAKGETHYFDVRLSPIKKGGKVVSIVSSSNHVTNRKKVEEALNKSEKRIRDLMANVPIGISVSTPEGDVPEVNKALLNIFGYDSKEEFVKVPAEAHYYDKKDREQFVKLNKKGPVKGLEFQFKQKDGSVFWGLIASKAVRQKDGKTEFINTFQDITERKLTQEALKSSEERLNAFFKNSPVGLAIIDSEYRYVSINQTLQRINGPSEAEHLGNTIWEVIPKTAPIAAPILEKIFSTCEPVINIEISGELPAHPDEITHYLVSYFPISVVDETPLYIGAAVVEITDRKQAEEKLKESEKSLRELTAHLQSAREQERTSIARELHDELGQTLTALNMDVSWLQKQLDQEQKNLRKKTQTMSSLIKDTIKVVQRISSELRPGQLDDLGLQATIEWYTGEFEARTEIKCRLNIEYTEEDINKEISTCIFRILQESLTNVARHSKASHVEVQLNKKDNDIELVVIDNGIGISKKQLVDSKSFGLIGMKERTEFLGGEVKIEGKKQKGTTVSVHIPL